jgi:hypothetical protein
MAAGVHVGQPLCHQEEDHNGYEQEWAHSTLTTR